MKRAYLLVLVCLLAAGMAQARNSGSSRPSLNDWSTGVLLERASQLPPEIRDAAISTIQSRGWRVTQKLHQSWSGSAWSDADRTFFTYDGNGRLSQQSTEIWAGSAWILYMRITYTYDGNGWLVETLYEMGAGSPAPWMKLTLTYEPGGHPVSQLLQQYSGGNWVNSQFATGTYDGGWHLTQVLQQVWSGSAWVDNKLDLYTYDGSWHITTLLGQRWTGTAWADTTRENYTYSGNDSIFQETDQVWVAKGSWVNDYLITNDWGGAQIHEKLEQDWQASAWVNIYRTTSHYTTNLTDDLKEDWISNVWVNDDLNLYSYEQTGVAGSSLIEPGRGRLLTNSPNPFRPSTDISYTVARPGAVSLAVYNLNGQRVKTLVNGFASSGSHRIAWNGCDDRGNQVPSGVYLYQLSSPDGTSVNRMILAR